MQRYKHHLEGPFTDFSIVHQEFGDLHVPGDRDVELHAAAIEVPGHQELSELPVEGSKVRHEAGCQRAIACTHDNYF